MDVNDIHWDLSIIDLFSIDEDAGQGAVASPTITNTSQNDKSGLGN